MLSKSFSVNATIFLLPIVYLGAYDLPLFLRDEFLSKGFKLVL